MTTFATKAATIGMIGFDTSERLDAAQAATLVALGMKFGVRYVAQSYQAPSVGITEAELEALTNAGLAMMLVQFARTSDWTATTGASDGTAAAKNALAVGYPNNACLWLDLEGSLPNAATTTAYVNAWYHAAASAGMDASALGVYVGPGVPLTSEQLYQDLYLSRYWKAGAMVPDVATRYFQMLQLYKGNVTVAPGIVIDWDVIEEDFLNGIPVLCVKA
jgi:hypothetical protein